MDALLAALQAALPGSIRLGGALRLPLAGGSVRIVQTRGTVDPQVEHGLVVGFVPALEEGLTLEACHLRARCRRSVEAIEAARALAEGRDAAQNATLLAVECAQQIADLWDPFLQPQAWVGPSVEDLLRQAANTGPGDAERLLALMRAAAHEQIGDLATGREWLKVAQSVGDPRVRQALAQVQRRLAQA